MNSKLILLLILSVISGIAFIAVGIYFSSKKYMEKLNNANPESAEKNRFRAKGTSIVSIALGGTTICWGILIFLFSQFSGPLGLVYMILLIVAFSFISFVFK